MGSLGCKNSHRSCYTVQKVESGRKRCFASAHVDQSRYRRGRIMGCIYDLWPTSLYANFQIVTVDLSLEGIIRVPEGFVLRSQRVFGLRGSPQGWKRATQCTHRSKGTGHVRCRTASSITPGLPFPYNRALLYWEAPSSSGPKDVFILVCGYLDHKELTVCMENLNSSLVERTEISEIKALWIFFLSGTSLSQFTEQT